MLELLYIGRFDYLARPRMNAQPHIPNDVEVDAYLHEFNLKLTKINVTLSQMKISIRESLQRAPKIRFATQRLLLYLFTQTKYWQIYTQPYV